MYSCKIEHLTRNFISRYAFGGMEIIMEITLENITNYIDFLIKSGLQVTVHGRIAAFGGLYRYNIHKNDYCRAVKRDNALFEKCIKQQKKVLAHCCGKSFFGTCHACVSEFIYPIRAGFISVSGYFENTPENAKKLSDFINGENTVSADVLSKRVYLKTEIPDKSQIDTLLIPLVCMCDNFFSAEILENISFFDSVAAYIAENYTQNITMSTLSRRFGYSVSTLSHMFKKESGKTLPQYIEDIRLNEACRLLEHTEHTVSEIAFSLGFCSANYFSGIFKKRIGLSPIRYRKKICFGKA